MRGFGVDQKYQLGLLGLHQFALGDLLQKGNLLLAVDVDRVLTDSRPVLHLCQGLPSVGNFQLEFLHVLHCFNIMNCPVILDIYTQHYATSVHFCS